MVNFCHLHNVIDKESAGSSTPYGIRVTLPANDSLRKILGDDWERTLWFRSAEERDAAFDNMAARHGYYRHTDSPTQVLEKIER